jgi:hypothetical protein
MQKLPAGLALGVAVACGPSPPDFSVDTPTVTLDPPAPLDRTPPVARFLVDGLRLPPSALVLVRGTVSDYNQGELRNGKLSSSLQERQVPVKAWVGGTKERIVVAPSEPLVPGETYAIAVLGSRSLWTLRIDQGRPFAERVWPPHEWPRGGGRWVFCGRAAPPTAGTAVTIDPGSLAATANPGADSEASMATACFRMDLGVIPRSGFGVPPPRFGGIALDPAPVDFTTESSENAPCPNGQVGMGTVCGEVLDDRVILRTNDEPRLLSFEVAGRRELDVLLPMSPVVVTGLTPATHVGARGVATDLAGHEAPFAVDLETTPPSPHVVLNEIMANPLGAEPAQEWIEIVNDGTLPVDLGGFSLDLSDGPVPLPSVTLESRRFAMLVSQSYAPADGRDVPPAPGTPILRLPRLGLSNSGETVILRAADGTAVSRFPALAPPRAGVSVARRAPSSLDSDPRAFGPHVGNGASPGWENDIDAP